MVCSKRKGYLTPVVEITSDPNFHSYQRFHQRWTRELDQMTRMASDAGDGRFYYSGMAKVVLLDRLDPGWKTRLFEPGVWLDELLAEAVKEKASIGVGDISE